MMNAVNKAWVLIFIGCTLLTCKEDYKKKETTNCKVFSLDILEDINPDIIEVCTTNNSTQIKLPNNSIFKIAPRMDMDYLTLKPSVENIYIEPNNIQLKEKGIRIKVRNTDMIPDYIFLDATYKQNKWFVERYGVINSNVSEDIYIKLIEINKPFIEEFGNEFVWNPSHVFLQYFSLN